jgi:SET domain-containing protein
MLMVPTELRPSRIHGVGVFSLKPIKKGKIVWHFDSRVDRVYAPDEVNSLPDVFTDMLQIYGYWLEKNELFVLMGDFARFVNHSIKPNLRALGPAFDDWRAARDIKAGEELTVDYRAACDYVKETGRLAP